MNPETLSNNISSISSAAARYSSSIQAFYIVSLKLDCSEPNNKSILILQSFQFALEQKPIQRRWKEMEGEAILTKCWLG